MHVCCCIEGGATVARGKPVWDVSVIHHLLHWYSIFEVSGARKDMMIETTSLTSMNTPVETQDLQSGYTDKRLHQALAEGGGPKLGFGIKIPRLNYVRIVNIDARPESPY
jgi:hypothetical protein